MKPGSRVGEAIEAVNNQVFSELHAIHSSCQEALQ